MAVHKGIDINGACLPQYLDYQKLKDGGVEFVIIKVSEGNWWDKAVYWRTHADGFRKVGIKVGFYLYSEANSVDYVRQETQFFIKNLNGYKPDMGCWWDIESSYAYNLAQKGIGLECLKAFKEIIEANGMEWGVYTNLNNNLAPLFGSYKNIKDLGGYVWVANYPKNGSTWDLDLPSKEYTCDIWQQSELGKISGANSAINIDLDICYYDGWFKEKSTKPNLGKCPDWAVASATKAVNNGIVHGYGNGDYGWNNNITRAEMVVLLDNLGLLK